jgi:DNA-directed RNA polymerase subunit M/transcription elongation factor TFIIS
MNKFMEDLCCLWKNDEPLQITKEDCWQEYCKRNKISGPVSTVIERLTFDNFDALQREFTSKSIVKCIACGGDHVDWRSVQTCRADESETIFAECKTCKKKWRFR